MLAEIGYSQSQRDSRAEECSKRFYVKADMHGQRQKLKAKASVVPARAAKCKSTKVGNGIGIIIALCSEQPVGGSKMNGIGRLWISA